MSLQVAVGIHPLSSRDVRRSRAHNAHYEDDCYGTHHVEPAKRPGGISGDIQFLSERLGGAMVPDLPGGGGSISEGSTQGALDV
jgi:hypothetical protein